MRRSRFVLAPLLASTALGLTPVRAESNLAPAGMAQATTGTERKGFGAAFSDNVVAVLFGTGVAAVILFGRGG